MEIIYLMYASFISRRLFKVIYRKVSFAISLCITLGLFYIRSTPTLQKHFLTFRHEWLNFSGFARQKPGFRNTTVYVWKRLCQCYISYERVFLTYSIFVRKVTKSEHPGSKKILRRLIHCSDLLTFWGH